MKHLITLAIMVMPVLAGLEIIDYRWLIIPGLLAWVSSIISVGNMATPTGDYRVLSDEKADAALRNVTSSTLIKLGLMAALYGLARLFA